LSEVTIGTLAIGTGLPKIGVVLSGESRQNLLGKAAQILTSATQIVFWRLNAYQELDNRAELINTAAQLQQILGTIPVVATFNHVTSAVDFETYFQTYQTLVNNRSVAAVDIDMDMVKQAQYQVLAEQIRANHVSLLVSQTQSAATQEALLATYQALAATGADLVQIISSATTAKDILTLMTATAEAVQRVEVPVIATAPGVLERYSSVCGQLTGSAIVFGRVGQAGNYGQLTVNQLQQTLQILSTTEGV